MSMEGWGLLTARDILGVFVFRFLFSLLPLFIVYS
jgi:hypothetical protein